jgi:hypothetical protein
VLCDRQADIHGEVSFRMHLRKRAKKKKKKKKRERELGQPSHARHGMKSNHKCSTARLLGL